MKQESSYPGRLSAVKRVFFAPVDQEKFERMRGNLQQDMIRVDLFNIR
ncbi:hypothetical protein [Arthrobacter sp. HY1533]|nr:hypothetical protein [Arthrobacter sp. HY1533]